MKNTCTEILLFFTIFNFPLHRTFASYFFPRDGLCTSFPESWKDTGNVHPWQARNYSRFGTLCKCFRTYRTQGFFAAGFSSTRVCVETRGVSYCVPQKCPSASSPVAVDLSSKIHPTENFSIKQNHCFFTQSRKVVNSISLLYLT